MKLLIAIVVFNRRLTDCESYMSLMKCKESGNCIFYIYNNSTIPEFQNIECPLDNVVIIEDSSNSGVSRAFNTAAFYGIKNDFEWILLADQDSKFPDSYLNSLKLAIQSNVDFNLFVPILESGGNVVSPCNFFLHRGSRRRNISIGQSSFNGLSILNSGMCISLSYMNRCGGFEERVFLDYSDFAFIRNYRKFSNTFFVINEKVEHDLSSEVNNFDRELMRYRMFCRSVLNYPKTFSEYFFIRIWSLTRCLKLSLKYRKLVFLSVFCNELIKGKQVV